MTKEAKSVERHAFDLHFGKENRLDRSILDGKLAKRSPWCVAQETNKREMAEEEDSR